MASAVGATAPAALLPSTSQIRQPIAEPIPNASCEKNCFLSGTELSG
jgi:hypothetical protein